MADSTGDFLIDNIAATEDYWKQVAEAAQLPFDPNPLDSPYVQDLLGMPANPAQSNSMPAVVKPPVSGFTGKQLAVGALAVFAAVKLLK